MKKAPSSNNNKGFSVTPAKPAPAILNEPVVNKNKIFVGGMKPYGQDNLEELLTNHFSNYGV
jgi:hypothetical protein